MLPLAQIQENLRGIGFDGIAQRLAREYRVPLSAMLGGDRHKTSTAARHHLWSLIDGTLAPSSVELARLFGVDHSTVLAALKHRHAWLAGESLARRAGASA